ncbi:hypothetical protein BBP40_001351 [Aspergillus hancockii]|nr:hypothetical protein BBP40_001351 [Aspergillus hancockii]
MTANNKILSLTFNHIVCPPRLPGKQETEAQAQEVQEDLLSRALDALAKLKDITDGESIVVWESLEKTDSNGDVIFETFETSPAADQTLAAKGALQWDFPGSAVSLPRCEFENPVFQKSLATFAERASSEVLDEFCPKTRKAGAEVSEPRDTVDPAIITQFLMTLLETNGSRVHPTLLRKRVKDDVYWDNAELPWRRSPFWLVLRVCIQRLLYLHLGAELGRMEYKFMMCTLMARLLADSVYKVDHEQCNFLKAKLCRRLAKLETERENSSTAVRDAHTRMFALTGPLCQQSIDIVTNALENQWRDFKRQIQRDIPLLPKRADDNDLRLRLGNSLPYLKEVLGHPRTPQWVQKVIDPATLDQNCKKDTTKEFADLTSRYAALAEKELAIENNVYKLPKSKAEGEALCMDLARQIQDYMCAVGDAYADDPEQMSVCILSIFELWIHMDKCATVAYPLLADYHPWLTPELLDVLLLSRLNNMERLQGIQKHLEERSRRATMQNMTIFSDPAPGGFADRYFGLQEAEDLRKLQQKIEEKSLRARHRKEEELEEVNAEYLDLTEKKAASYFGVVGDSR